MVRIFLTEENLEDYEYVRVAVIESEGITTWTSQDE